MARCCRAGLVSTVSVPIQPTLVGGTSPKVLFRGEDLTSVEQSIGLRLTHVERLEGGVVWLVYDVGLARKMGWRKLTELG